jgi:hypothetical protein
VAFIFAPPCVLTCGCKVLEGRPPRPERGTLRVRGLAALALLLNALHRSRSGYDRLPHPLTCPETSGVYVGPLPACKQTPSDGKRPSASG